MRRTAVSLFTLAVLALVLSPAQAEIIRSTDRNQIQVETFLLRNERITMTDAGAAGSQGGVKLKDWVAGQVRVLGATSDLDIVAASGITSTASVVCSVGEVVAAVSDATLTSTEADIINSTAATLTSSAGTCNGKYVIGSDAVFDGTTTAIDAWLNFAVPDAGSTANSTITVNGKVTISYVLSGDF